jgi:hypothetical protein
MYFIVVWYMISVDIIIKFIARLPIYKYYLRYKIRERRVQWGNSYHNHVFYVIGMNDPYGGLWWLINKVVMHIAYAEQKGYIPVVDMQNYWTQYSRPETFGKINVWELFFKQPGGFSLNDIKNAKNVVLCKKEPAPSSNYLMGQNEFYDNIDRMSFFRGIFHKYIHLNAQTSLYLQRERESLFKGRKRMVGVLCRGTDYVVIKPKAHPIQPEPCDVVNDVKRILDTYECEGVFLATEDQDILDIFKESFGEKLTYIDQPRLRKEDLRKDELLSKTKLRLNKNTTPFEDGVKYLTSTYILSCCTCFLSGRTGGAKGVLLQSKEFEYCKIYDLGLYP